MTFTNIARFQDPVQAELALAYLRGEGIDASLCDREMASMNWFLIPVIGGMRLQVSSEDVERARTLLADFDGEWHLADGEVRPAEFDESAGSGEQGGPEEAYFEVERSARLKKALGMGVLLIAPVVGALVVAMTSASEGLRRMHRRPDASGASKRGENSA